jgi:hypothetical protein
MTNYPFKLFDPIEEEGLQVVQGQFVRYPMKRISDFFNGLKYLILDFSPQQAKSRKIARTQVWRTREVTTAAKLQIGKFISHIAIIVMHGIVHLHKNSPVQTRWEILPLASSPSDRMLLTKYS